MNESNSLALQSRRNWLGVASLASLGATLATSTAVADDNSAAAGPAVDAGACVYNIRDFGAKGDGKTLDTVALQAAIDACTSDHGGIVLVPAGVFIIGTTEMKSNVTLRLAAGATLLGSGDGKQYKAAAAIPLDSGWTMGDGHVGLIFAANAENITIEGPGMIDGNGLQFHPAVRGAAPPSGVGGHGRPYHLLFYQCKNLTVRDIFLKDSAYHSLRICMCTFVNLNGIHIHSRVTGNNDGFHFISSQHVHVSNSSVECEDDACALFGSCKFVTITNSAFSTRWSVFRFGGGEAENIVVSNCILYQAYGCPIKLRCSSGSRFENMIFSDIVMNGVTGPISIGLGPQREGGEQGMPPGVVRNISFSGIRATVTRPTMLPDAQFGGSSNPGEIFSCIILNGMDAGFLQNISFNDVQVTFPGGGTAAQAAVRNVPKLAGEYYAIGVPPACGLFARNIKGLTLHNVRFDTVDPDLRPAVVFDHVTDAAINGLSAPGNKDAESALRFIESADVLLTATRLRTPAPVFLQVEGGSSAGITIDGGDISNAAAPLAFKNGAAEAAVKLRG
jgi:hypothetical protein